MNKDKGYVLIWRPLMEKGYYKKSQYIHLWIHLILKANHTDIKSQWNGKETIIKRGQFITGRKKLSEETGIKETTIERILKVFENGQQIGQQKSNLCRIITITNYNELQKVDNKKHNKRTTNGQQTDTSNTLNIKDTLNTLKFREHIFLTEQEYSKLIEKFTKPIADDWIERANLYAEKIGVRKFNKQYASHYATILTWDRMKKEKNGTFPIKTESLHQHKWNFNGHFYECNGCREKTYIKPEDYKEC